MADGAALGTGDVSGMAAAFGQSGLVSIQDILGTLPDAPVATTRERTWRGVTIDIHARQPGYAIRSPAHDHHLLCYCASGGGRLVQARDGVVHDSVISAGMSLLMPAGFDSTWQGDAAASARIRIPTALVDAAAEQIGHRSATRFEIRNIFEVRDATLERIAQVFMAELDRPPHDAQLLIADTMASALAGHLLRSYNAFELPECGTLPVLERADLARLTAYVEANLDKSIGLVELASLVNVSRFHFTRLFKRSTGMTAIGFVEQCRIRRAKALIAESHMPLADIAFMTGFADQSHFTRRFHRHVGCTPAAFARETGRRRPGRRRAE